MKKTKRTAFFGSWKSPITGGTLTAQSIGFGQLAIDGSDCYWLEKRPSEKGRGVIVKRDAQGQLTEINPPLSNVRTRAHEYGGGDFVVHKGEIYFSNFADQNVYRAGKMPKNLTSTENICYADFIIDAKRNRLVCVEEDRSISGQEAKNSLIAIDLKSGQKKALVEGNDFYSSPKISPDGKKLAWLTWDHPRMPWDGTELFSGELGAGGSLQHIMKVAGGTTESVFQPEWSPSGELYFISDRNNWWNLYHISKKKVEPVLEVDAELGMPQWVFGMSTYAFTDTGEVVCRYKKDGELFFMKMNAMSKKTTRIDVPFSNISEIRVAGEKALLHVSYQTKANEIVFLDLKTAVMDVLKTSSTSRLEKKYISLPQAITFAATDNQVAHAYFYPPKNDDYQAPKDTLPPLIVKVHGGPTSAASDGFSLAIQYWTSRGFAVVDVDYRGSTGYGRKYRDLLKGKWGVVDTVDAVAAAKYLAGKRLVDPKRLAITGGSAGGFTVLSALTFYDVFHAGASHYGVSDLELLVRDIHKFESRYLDALIGPYPAAKDIYQARSPIHHAHKLSRPVIFFQGLEDLVVPPNQAEKMVEMLREKGIPVAYVPFAGEQHGFRQAANIKRAIEGEYYFYSRIFGFEIIEEIETIEIKNLS